MVFLGFSVFTFSHCKKWGCSDLMARGVLLLASDGMGCVVLQGLRPLPTEREDWRPVDSCPEWRGLSSSPWDIFLV